MGNIEACYAKYEIVSMCKTRLNNMIPCFGLYNTN